MHVHITRTTYDWIVRKSVLIWLLSQKLYSQKDEYLGNEIFFAGTWRRDDGYTLSPRGEMDYGSNDEIRRREGVEL